MKAGQSHAESTGEDTSCSRRSVGKSDQCGTRRARRGHRCSGISMLTKRETCLRGRRSSAAAGPSLRSAYPVRPVANSPAAEATIISAPTFGEAFSYWVRLGFINFGGPAGQIAIMHRELVDQRHWVSEGLF